MTAGHVTHAPGTGWHVPHISPALVLTFIVGVTAGVGLAAVVANLGIGSPSTPRAVVTMNQPAPGDFRLSPGNAEPLGVVVSIPRIVTPAVGEFRLGPGNQMPPGDVVPAPKVILMVDVPGDFRLGPGNTEPVDLSD